MLGLAGCVVLLRLVQPRQRVLGARHGWHALEVRLLLVLLLLPLLLLAPALLGVVPHDLLKEQQVQEHWQQQREQCQV